MVRLFDPRLPSNRLVLSAFVVALVAGTIVTASSGDGIGPGVSTGMQAGFTALLSWAIARELDPDRPSSATIALFAGLAIFFTGEVRLAIVMTLMFAIRIVARSPGEPPTMFDLAWLLGLCAFSAKPTGGWVAGVALGLALMWDARLVRPGRKPSLVVGAVGVCVAIAIAVLEDNALPGWTAPSIPQAVVLVGGALGAAALSLLRNDELDAVEDYSDRRMSLDRVNRCRAVAVVAAAASFALLGGPAAPAIVGLWAGLIGVGVRVLLDATTARKEVAA